MTGSSTVPYLLDVLPCSAARPPAPELADTVSRVGEPAVGEIRALRTFRLSSDGRLCSVSEAHAWTTGTNTARCRYSRNLDAHPVPDLDCSCGLHACVTTEAVEQIRPARPVLAVVSCWGHVVVNADGIRAEHARIEAVRLPRDTPGHLRLSVRSNYPGTEIFRSRGEMLTAYPVTTLDSRPPVPSPSPERLPRRLPGSLGGPGFGPVLTALILGCLPAGWTFGHRPVLAAWSIGLGLCAAAALRSWTRPVAFAGGRRLLALAMLCWLLSPLGGPLGTWLLRLPVLKIVALTGWQRLRAVTIRIT